MGPGHVGTASGAPAIEAFAISQRKHNRDEEVFGWCKVVGGMRRMRVAGRWT